MRYLKELITVLALFLLIGNVSAEDSYDVTLTVLRPDNMNDLENTTWSRYDEIVLDKNERVDCIHKIMILDVSLNTDTVYVEVIKNGERFTSFIRDGEEAIFGHDHELDFKIRVKSMEIKTLNGDGVIGNEDDVVSVWIAPNSVDRLHLSPSIPETYDPSAYGKTAGWSGTGSIESATLYIERIQSIYGVAVSITGKDWEEKSTGNENRRKFELKENGVYIITIDYQRTDSWGGVIDETEVYTLTLKGLKYGSSTGTTSTTSTSGNYNDIILKTSSGTAGNYIIVESSTQGTWEEVDGCAIKLDGTTPTGTIGWKVKFDDAGNQKVGFTETDGRSGYYRFIIAEKTPQPVATTVVADQTAPESKSSVGTVLAVFGLIILVCAVAIVINKKSREKKGRDNTGGSRVSPDIET